MEYTFGDSDIAAHRLAVLAQVFEESSAAFIREAAPTSVRTVVDLGCGPGHTTALLESLFPEAYVLGLDRSAHFIDLARRWAAPRLRFKEQDVVASPLPESPDILYCRFLLTHLPHPVDALSGWSRQCQPGAMILLEEVERIDAELPCFRRYLRIVADMLAEESQALYVGPLLARSVPVADTRVVINRPFLLRVPDRQAARMFYPNWVSWRDRPFVQQSVPGDGLAGLGRELAGIAASGGGETHITWTLRQIAVRRE